MSARPVARAWPQSAASCWSGPSTASERPDVALQANQHVHDLEVRFRQAHRRVDPLLPHGQPFPIVERREAVPAALKHEARVTVLVMIHYELLHGQGALPLRADRIDDSPFLQFGCRIDAPV